MSLTEFNFYKQFKQDRAISGSKIPKSIMNSTFFKQLINGNIITTEKSGRGKVYSISDNIQFEQIFKTKYNDEFINNNTRIGNTLTFRNSKATSIITNNVFFLRGFKNCILNQTNIDLNFYTKSFGLFAFSGNCQIITDKICFVENLECFFNAEKLIGIDYTYIHKYGRIGKTDFNNIRTDKVLVFNDYDLVGLNEYLKIKEQNSKAELFVPNNFSELYSKYSTSIKQGSQIITQRIKESTDETVVMIKNMILNNNRILEQESLFIVTF